MKVASWILGWCALAFASVATAQLRIGDIVARPGDETEVVISFENYLAPDGYPFVALQWDLVLPDVVTITRRCQVLTPTHLDGGIDQVVADAPDTTQWRFLFVSFALIDLPSGDLVRCPITIASTADPGVYDLTTTTEWTIGATIAPACEGNLCSVGHVLDAPRALLRVNPLDPTPSPTPTLVPVPADPTLNIKVADGGGAHGEEVTVGGSGAGCQVASVEHGQRAAWPILGAFAFLALVVFLRV